VVEAFGAAGSRVGFVTRPVRAATLGRLVAAIGVADLLAGDFALALNGVPLQRDPATPLVAGDRITVTT
jgi:hypothetical protein